MPIDQSTDPVTATTRRTFLARTAGVGALVTAGALVSPVSPLSPWAGAQDSSSDVLTDAEFAAFATPLELAAVQAYQGALTGSLLSPEHTTWAQQFQRNHQGVADTLATLLPEDATAPVADADLVKSASAAIDAAADENSLLRALSSIEDTIAATHLSAIPVLREASTAKTVAQALAVENQQAALLAVAAGAAVADTTPATASTDGAIKPSADSSATTTTTAAAN